MIAYIEFTNFWFAKPYKWKFKGFNKIKALIYSPKELAYQALSNEPNRQSYFSSDPSLRRGFGRQEGGKTGVMPKHNAFMSRHSSSGRIFPTPSRRKRTSLWGSGFSAWCTRFLVVAANSFADDIIYTATEVAATLPE